MKQLRKLLYLGLSTLMIMSMVGCASGDGHQGITEQNSQQSSPQNNQAQDAATRVVQSLKGEVAIPTSPQRIVDISGSTEELIILGEKVVGTANVDSYQTDQVVSYLQEDLKEVTIVGHSMMDTMDVEAILALQPDMILMGQRQEKIYDQLAAIAPTVMLKEYNNDWEEKLLDVAKLFDKEAFAKEWLEDYSKEAEAIGEAVKRANGEAASYLTLLAGQGQFWVFSDAGIGSMIDEDMDLKSPEGLPEQQDISLPVITLEGLTQINADYFVVIAGAAEKAELEGSSIWQGMDSVKAGHVIYLEQSPYFTQGYNPIGRQLLLEQLKAILTQNQ